MNSSTPQRTSFDPETCDSPKGLAKRRGIGVATVFREIARGALRARKLGRRTLITAADEAAWLANLPLAGASNAPPLVASSSSKAKRGKARPS
jgi:hypothetical protein